MTTNRSLQQAQNDKAPEKADRSLMRLWLILSFLAEPIFFLGFLFAVVSPIGFSCLIVFLPLFLTPCFIMLATALGNLYNNKDWYKLALLPFLPLLLAYLLDLIK